MLKRFRSVFGMLGAFFRRSKLEDRLRDELQLHVDLLTEKNIRLGIAPYEAQRQARMAVGGFEQARETVRDARGFGFIEDIGRDFRYGLRALHRSPGFAAVAALTLAIGIGANTAIFTAVYAVLWQPLPYPYPERLVVLETTFTVPGKPVQVFPEWSYPRFEALRSQDLAFSELAAFSDQELNLTGAGNAERTAVELVTAQYFSMLGIGPIQGRTFRPEEHSVPNRDPVALVSEGLWRARFDADPELIGRTVTINKIPLTVVGILPRTFRGQSGTAEIWIPMAMAPALTNNPKRLQQQGAFWHRVLGRLKAGVTHDQAQAEMAAAEQRIEATVAPQGRRKAGIQIVSLKESKTDPSIRKSLLVLFGAVAFVLLISCSNVANLLLAKATSRQKEVSLRLALGATQGRIVRQFLTEGLLLSLIAGGLALLVALAGMKAVGVLQPANPGASTLARYAVLPDFASLGLGAPVFAFNLVVSLLTSIFFALVPSFRASKTDLNVSLKEAPGQWAQSRRGRPIVTGRRVLVVAELSLALTLLTGAGLLVKSFVRLLTTDLGIPTKNLLTLKIDLPRTYTEAAGSNFFRQLLDRVASLPGVRSAALTNAVPLTGSYDRTTIIIQSSAETTDSNLFAGVHVVSPSMLQTLSVPLLHGRWFTDQDRSGTPMVAVINETAALKYWAGRNPIGDRVRLAIDAGPDGVAAEIVGVVADVKYDNVETPVGVDIYVSYLQSSYPGYYIVVSARQEPLSLAAAVRGEVASLDRDLPIYEVRTMDQRVAEATSKTRFSAFLMGVFAGLALTLSAIGVYGLIAYTAARRTHEMGIRMALGAKVGDILALIISEALYLTLIGLGIGLGVSLSLMRLLTGMLYVVKPTDPTNLLSVSLSLVAVALVASYIPARRATKVDPLIALRHE